MTYYLLDREIGPGKWTEAQNDWENPNYLIDKRHWNEENHFITKLERLFTFAVSIFDEFYEFSVRGEKAPLVHE